MTDSGKTNFQSYVVRICTILTSLSFIVLIVAVIIQVVGRTIGFSPVWTEELTRFALLFLTAFGSGLSLLSGDLVNIDVFYKSLPKKLSYAFQAISQVFIIIFCSLLILPAIKYVSIGSIQYSPALGWRMDYIHASVLILITLLLVFSCFVFIKLFQQEQYRNSELITKELIQ